MLWTRAARADGSGNRPIGMFKPSAKVSIFLARPSAWKSERILTVSRGRVPSRGRVGIFDRVVTQSRPRSSKARLSGLWMSGSEATSWISKPGGNVKRLPFVIGRARRQRRDVFDRCGALGTADIASGSRQARSKRRRDSTHNSHIDLRL